MITAMWWLWLLIGLIGGFLIGRRISLSNIAIELGQSLVDIAILRALVKTLLGVCNAYHDDLEVAAVIGYTRSAAA